MAKQLMALRALGMAVARVVEQRRPERDLAIEQARSRFLADCEAIAAPSEQRTQRWTLGLVPAMLAAAVLVLILLTRGESPLTFQVDGRRGDLDAWLAAPKEQPVTVGFSDGTDLRVERSSRARVMGVTPHGAKVSLESGRIHAEVVHRPQSAWSFIAGPIHVRVIGTKFDITWDPSVERFTVTVAEGSVGVSGSIAGAERAVRAGETLSISVRERRLELINTDANATGMTRTASEPTTASLSGFADLAPRAEEREPAPAPDNGAPAATSAQAELTQARKSSRWRELADRGQLREAYAAAEAFGFHETCQTASPTELLLLGDAARLAGRPDHASTALTMLRQRYPNDSRRAAAAFVLGKIAFDQRRAYDVAAHWFTTCLREQPSGGFAREAAGRLIEAYRAAGNRNAAQIAARDYLARYPNGPHADLARSLLP